MRRIPTIGGTSQENSMRAVNQTPGSKRLTPVLPGLLLIAGLIAGCQPTVRIEAPREPITINLNIKIEADVLVRVEDKAKDDIAANPDIF